MYKEQHIRIQRHTRYFTQGDPSASHWIYVIHGYGQLASRFIRKFEPLQSIDRFFIAPEGLHRYYLEGHQGHVGASWMTREDRETDIQDYVKYLNQLHGQLSENKKIDKLTILAFSQGVATAFRWIADQKTRPDQFLICSGVIPPDLDLDLKADTFRPVELRYLTGDNDPFKKDHEVNAALKRLNDEGIQCPTHTFHGGHRVDIPTIEALL